LEGGIAVSENGQAEMPALPGSQVMTDDWQKRPRLAKDTELPAGPRNGIRGATCRISTCRG